MGYFGALGLGYILVEVPLLQQFILFLDYPVHAFAVVVGAILVASGAGSLLSRHLPWRTALTATAVMAVLYPALLRAVFGPGLGWPWSARAAFTVLLLAPLGFSMGVGFPRGVTETARRRPGLIPWAWAVNGSLSVVSSVGAALLALSFGFRAVLLAGSFCYLVAVASSTALLRLPRRSG